MEEAGHQHNHSIDNILDLMRDMVTYWKCIACISEGERLENESEREKESMMMIAFIITLGENNAIIAFGTLSSFLT